METDCLTVKTTTMVDMLVLVVWVPKTSKLKTARPPFTMRTVTRSLRTSACTTTPEVFFLSSGPTSTAAVAIPSCPARWCFSTLAKTLSTPRLTTSGRGSRTKLSRVPLTTASSTSATSLPPRATSPRPAMACRSTRTMRRRTPSTTTRPRRSPTRPRLVAMACTRATTSTACASSPSATRVCTRRTSRSTATISVVLARTLTATAAAWSAPKSVTTTPGGTLLRGSTSPCSLTVPAIPRATRVTPTAPSAVRTTWPTP
mmetsp:Transcript_38651/g.66821  ORF Transcript_38651/g.66821 Transcript_38651/m.66821 type:complete len:259 (-) Transcript_38651:1808-2584(-)